MTSQIAQFEIFASDVERACGEPDQPTAVPLPCNRTCAAADDSKAGQRSVGDLGGGASPKIDATASRSGEGSSARPLSHTSGAA